MKTIEENYLLFKLEDRQFAIPVVEVNMVVAAVAITDLPQAPEIVLGIINVHGDAVPVINIRPRIGLAPKELELTDKYIIAEVAGRKIALLVDSINTLIEIDSKKIVQMESLVPGSKFIDGTAEINNDLILLLNLENFLSIEDNLQLNSSLEQSVGLV